MKYTIGGTEIIKVGSRTLHRIKNLSSGNLGGFVESYDNLSQDGHCWIYNEAKVFDTAWIGDDAIVMDNAIVKDSAYVVGSSRVYDNAVIGGNAIVSGEAVIRDDSDIRASCDYIVFKNWWSSHRYFTWTRSNNKWSVGCFYGTGEELIARAYADSKKSGKEYERVVNYVNSILKDESSK